MYIHARPFLDTNRKKESIMDKEQVKKIIDQINAILQNYDITSSSLVRLRQQLDELPDGKVVDKYNELVVNVRQARGYDNFVASAETLLSYYDTHKEDLSQKQSEMTNLRKVVDENKRLHDLYNQLESELN